MIRNDFLDAEDDIFDDLDQRMYRAVMYDPWLGFSLYEGLTGYGRYWISRLRQRPLSTQAQECLMCITKQIEESLLSIPKEEQADVSCFLHDLHEISGFDAPSELLEQCREQVVDMKRGFPRLGDFTIGHIIQMYQRNRYFSDTLQDEMDMALKQIPDLDMEKPPVAMGLLTGYAGEGLVRLAVLDSTNIAWMQLL